MTSNSGQPTARFGFGQIGGAGDRCHKLTILLFIRISQYWTSRGTVRPGLWKEVQLTGSIIWTTQYVPEVLPPRERVHEQKHTVALDILDQRHHG